MFGILARLGVFLGGLSLFLALGTVWLLLLRNPQLLGFGLPAAEPIPWSVALEPWAKIGQVMSGTGFMITAIMAVVTLFFVHRKQMDDEWLDRFRNLYDQFWKEEQMVTARYLVNNAPGYDELKRILLLRAEKDECDIPWVDYEKLEIIDRFCSILSRVRSFGLSIDMTPVQEELWGDLLFHFWILKIQNRNELRCYVKRHWGKLLDPVKVRRRKRYVLF